MKEHPVPKLRKRYKNTVINLKQGKLYNEKEAKVRDLYPIILWFIQHLCIETLCVMLGAIYFGCFSITPGALKNTNLSV